MSLSLHRYLDPSEIEKFITIAIQGCGRDVAVSEIHDAVEDSLAVHRSGRREGAGKAERKSTASAGRKWSPINTERLSEIISSSIVTSSSLKAASPMQIDPDENVNLYLYHLFQPGDLLCIGRSQRDFRTMPYKTLITMKFGDICLVVPSPMTSKYGLTKQGKKSQHTLSNTGPRRFLVTEFDSGTFDEQAAVIGHLKESMPLVMVLYSCGKSLHAWWSCADRTEDQLWEFFKYAVTLGADKATWSPAQFVRLPQGWRRDKNAVQLVHYFDRDCLPGSESINRRKGESNES